MHTGAVTAAAAGGAAAVLVMGIVTTMRRRHARRGPDRAQARISDVARAQGDVLRTGGTARFRITFADGTTTDVEADRWRSGTCLAPVILLHHIIDLTGGHAEVVARYEHGTSIQRLD